MRFRAGWLIPKHLLALTHFEPVVTPEDFQQITQDAENALQSADEPFHLLIDNRNIAEATQVPLEMMLNTMPMLNQPHLRWVVVIVPEGVSAQNLANQQVGAIQLTYVDSLDEAYTHLQSVDARIDPAKAHPSFFIDDNTR